MALLTNLQSQLDWLGSLPHPYKAVIAGNHDRLLDPGFLADHPERITEQPGSSRDDLDWHDITYLQNSCVTFPLSSTTDSAQHWACITRFDPNKPEVLTHSTLKVYGSPFTPLCGTFAFQYPPIRDVWQGSVPIDADIVLTHGPPKGFLDALGPGHEGRGCPHLVRELKRVRPRVVVFGHIHSGFGREEVRWDSGIERKFSHLMEIAEGQKRESAFLILLGLFWGLATAWVEALISWTTGGRLGGTDKTDITTMVNAAVGAERALQRSAMVVEI